MGQALIMEDREMAEGVRMLIETLQELLGNHTVEEIQSYISIHEEKLTRITHYTSLLNEINQDADKKGYQRGVRQIMDVTMDYYMFIGGLPEDFRHFFFLFREFVTNTSILDQVNRHVGQVVLPPIQPKLSIQSIRPQSYIMQIDAITNHLASLQDENKMRVGSQGNRPVYTTVTLDMPDTMRIEGGEVLSTYDKSIINGVTSLMESGNTVFSIPMLYHAMTGRDNPTVDEQLFQEITWKLDRMRRMMLTIDLTEENEAQYIKKENGEVLTVEDLTVEGYLLPLNKVSGTVNGKHTVLYQIIQHPPLYTYSKLRRQLASVSISLLGAPINNNATTIPLKTYLLQRIELMRNQRNNIVSNRILYDSVYGELGEREANKTRKMRIRTYTETILEHFVLQGYILGYNQVKKGRTIAGLDILL